jgi:hypothetical protein
MASPERGLSYRKPFISGSSRPRCSTNRLTITSGTNRVIGVEPHAIYRHWRRAVDGEWPKGELPEAWDGQTARRIVKILLEAR